MADAVPTRRSSRAKGVSTTPTASTSAPQAASRALSRRESRAASLAILAEAPVAAEHVTPVAAAPVAVAPAPVRLRSRTRPVLVEEPVAAEVEAELPETELPETELPVAEAAPTATGAVVTDFDAAARLFAFTGETPVICPTVPAPSQSSSAVATKGEGEASTPLASQQQSLRRKLATTAFSVGVMGIVTLMAVTVSAPAEAVAAASDTVAVTTVAPELKSDVIKPEEIQVFVAPAEGEVVELDRDQTYALTTFEQIALESGIRMTKLFVNDANSAIQWPFAVGVGMSYGYGPRSGGMHEGIDFTPGAGAQVQAVAEGTVRVATESGGAYGVHVYIDHEVDGQMISSHYAHMQYGSLQVVEGQHVMAGDPVGKTGNTGRSYGAHMHFELRVNGDTAIDPLPWLQKHAGGWQG